MKNDKIEELKKKFEKEGLNLDEIKELMSLYEKEINDLKEMEKIYIEISEEFLEFKEQTSKKVEELKKIIGKNALKRDWDYIKEIDEIFPPQNNIPQRDKKFAKKEVKK